ncbi:type VII secretion integral membrane protein EccD [Actinomadura parmotrematis]|uniref:Type VII secretion integral membrane protein EccD n=1 Tax=Actinomadura parmotrematis TaxID=2864039 RepID=A0ABS7FXU7_9ACTN|nr:type VII secretion integral membrane protein EccD [Actinomadura parmotrematis]MBW8485254.1 type VII secretion integral membrane protein EccD [Actinomadura parmotrematis]
MTELSRVTIVAPRRRIDVSLPSDVPLAHMLPTLLRAAGEQMADAGLAHSGWVLQRLDEGGFDPSQTLSALGVRDGEILYFRPRMAQLPEMSFDDVADVIATGIKDRSDRWRPTTTRAYGLGAAAAALTVGAAVIALSGPPWLAPAGAAGLIALIGVIVAAMLSRAYGDSGAGAVLGYAILPHAFLAGLLAPARDRTALLDLGAPHLLAGFGVLTLFAVIAMFAVADGLPVFLGAAIAGVVGAAGAAVGFVTSGLPAAGIAAVCAVVVMMFIGAIPGLAFKLARMPLPPVPGSAEELRRDTENVDGRAVLARTAAADRFATGLIAAIALVSAGAMLALAAAGGWAARATIAAMALSLLLRARVFRGLAQRAWMLVAGLTGLGLLALSAAGTGDQYVVLAATLVPLLAVTGIVIGVTMWLPAHKPTPFWGRAGDILDILVMIALIPLALAVLDVFSRVRGLAG